MRPLVYLILLFFSFSLIGKSTLSYRERKKQFDQKISLITDIQDSFSIQEEPGKNPLRTVRTEVEEVYRAGGRAQMEKTLSLAEGEVVYAARKLCPKLEELSADIYQKAQSSYYSLETDEKSSGKKLEWETKEKIQRYLSMAKSEKDHAKDFFLSGNYHMSLHTYKRSILYSLLSLRTQNAEIPEGYQTAANVWAEPVFQTVNQQKSSSIREN
ncbi:hypothetical protein [Leptospira idonii]|uniref:Uncharacterized protein n=1 Tax=Leptospira idonii TaxID=1193500 RepID=A0A4R9LZW8_9LEPT|nr:hypothetical protein [Leptospira idonii]TGN19933.1 hypothetical protein EHS15_06020 [Leptospira idonii]